MKQTTGFNRRQFLKLAGGAALAAGLPIVSPAIGLASLDKRNKVAQATHIMMGTLVSVTVVDASAVRAQQAMNAAFREMALLTPVFDRHSESGMIALLNREGQVKDLPPMMARVLTLCEHTSRISGGAFDISVAPVVDAFRSARKKTGALPSEGELAKALRAVGGVELSADGARLTKEGAAVTLDGVAKGFIVDCGLQAAAKAGARSVLVNAGGDVGCLGDRGQGRPWRVAVSDPNNPSRNKLVVSMTGGAMATSGNYEVFFDEEKLYHHIIDPASGVSPRTDASASVRAPSAAQADALSTACFVMKPRMAMRLVKSQPQVEALVLTRRGQRYQSPGFVS